MDYGTLSPNYVCLAIFRVLSTLFVQNGYVHPDEFFQTTEIITGDVFGVVHNRSWEFNEDAPVRSIGLLYGIFGVPLYIAQFHFKLYEIRWTPFLLLFVMRLTTCAVSFITDYSLYKICKRLRIKPNRYLLLLASSYVIIVFGTKTFTNTLELALVSLLLWKVVDSLIVSEKVLAAENEIRNAYAHSTAITDKIIVFRKLRKLPSHNYLHCFEIGCILAAGTFNRPTFVLFAVTPIFFWLSRGVSKNFKHPLRVFNMRFFVLFLCLLPGVFLFVTIDSYYYGYITENGANFVVTPFNFIKYNINPSNLADHGIHSRITHTIINIPLLFNILTLLFLGRLQLNSLFGIIVNAIVDGRYHILPNIHEVNTLMMANVIIPLCLLSIFPHQEPRFLLPLLLPIVFTTSKYFYGHYITKFKQIIPIWCISNFIGLLFYGYLHQAGITPMISHLFQDVQHVSNTHIIHSHTYSIPVGLLMVPQQNERIPFGNQRRIKIHDLGSSMDPDDLYDTIIRIIKNVVTLEKEPGVYVVLSGPLIKSFELIANASSLVYTKKSFFPHVSTESLSLYVRSIIDLLYHDKNKSYFSTLMELPNIFSLVLYKITTETDMRKSYYFNSKHIEYMNT